MEYERGYRDGYRDGLADINKYWPKPEPSSPKCSKCGISFEGFMGYVCSQSGCPVMPIIYCNNEGVLK